MSGLRPRLRAFLSSHHPGRPPRDPEARLTWTRTWLATLADGGLAGPAWPVEHGGMGLSFADQVTYQEELVQARVPGVLGTGVANVGPVLVEHGTPAQQERWLRPMLRGEQVWAQAYAEPEAGSDLAALQTTARLDGDAWVVNGTKTWVAQAGQADLLYVLVRTGGARESGLSLLALDARSPGVTTTPLRDLTGAVHFSTVTLDGVRVPVDHVLGPVDGGWPLARLSLGHERLAGVLNQVAKSRRVLDELITLVRDRGRAEDPAVIAGLVDLEVRVRTLRANALRLVSDITTRDEPGPLAAVQRLAVAAFEQDLHEWAVDVLGPAALLERADPFAVHGAWQQAFLMTRASTLGAGTVELARLAVAEQVLGLPPDPGMPTG